jgi:uncharacterized SAM-binding protein YcdF (DUF218 family)
VPRDAGRPGHSRAAAAAQGGAVLSLCWLGAGELGLDAVAGVQALDLLPVTALAGAVAGAAGWDRWLRPAAVAVVGALLLAALGPGLRGLLAPLVREDPLPPGAADAVVVLAGSVSADGRIGPAAADRLLEGARLVRAGAATQLVVSRVHVTHRGDTVTSDADVASLLAAAGLTARVHTLHPVGTTRLEAVRLRELAGDLGWRRVIVVTSPLHTRRACAAVAATGLAVHCRPAPERSIALATLPRPRDRIRAAGGWLYETLGWLAYRARGWVGPRDALAAGHPEPHVAPVPPAPLTHVPESRP